jgi:hypothetical protein
VHLTCVYSWRLRKHPRAPDLRLFMEAQEAPTCTSLFLSAQEVFLSMSPPTSQEQPTRQTKLVSPGSQFRPLSYPWMELSYRKVDEFEQLTGWDAARRRARVGSRLWRTGVFFVKRQGAGRRCRLLRSICMRRRAPRGLAPTHICFMPCINCPARIWLCGRAPCGRWRG